MISDARTLDQDAIIEADLCIVGAGPAALAVARQFEGASCSVVMLEAGGVEREADDSDDRPATDIRFGTVRGFTNTRSLGGSASQWNIQTDLSRSSVRLLPLADADLERKPWLADSGWPIKAADLADHYRRAQVLFGLPEIGFAPDHWEEPWARLLPVANPDVRTAVFQFASGDALVETHRRVLEASRNVTILHHATALEVLTNETAAHATAIKAASLPGRHLEVRARHFVLAAGGIGSTALLLSSDGVQPGGLGNAFDNVGRYFMDHPLLLGGEFLPASRRLFDAMAFYDLRSVRGTPVMGHLQLSDAALRRDPLLNLSAIFLPRERGYEAHRRLSVRQQVAFEAALRLRHALWQKRRPSATDAWRAVRGIDGIAKRGADRLFHPKSNLGHGGWSKLSRRTERFDRFEVLHQAEQAPHRDNRIALSREVNRFGTRRVHVDWRWHEEDMARTMRGQEVFARALGEAGLGEFRPAREDGRPVVLSSSTSHFMGTTRMHEDPLRGVVDAQCRVHGMDNLFVASSGVFPTGGFANPTLTIVALALRLGDRIANLLQRGSPGVHLEI